MRSTLVRLRADLLGLGSSTWRARASCLGHRSSVVVVRCRLARRAEVRSPGFVPSCHVVSVCVRSYERLVHHTIHRRRGHHVDAATRLDRPASASRRGPRQALRRPVGPARPRSRRRARHGPRPARPQRRRQDHRHPHPHHPRRADRGHGHRGRLRRRRATPTPCAARIGVAAQQATVDGLLTARANLVMVGRLHHLPKRRGPPPGRRAARAARPRRRRRPAGQDLLRAACAAGSTSPPASSPHPRCCSSTSRPPGSTRAAATTCGTCSATSSATAPRSSSRRSTSRRPTGWPTTSSCSTTAAPSPTARPHELKAQHRQRPHRRHACVGRRELDAVADADAAGSRRSRADFDARRGSSSPSRSIDGVRLMDVMRAARRRRHRRRRHQPPRRPRSTTCSSPSPDPVAPDRDDSARGARRA